MSQNMDEAGVRLAIARMDAEARLQSASDRLKFQQETALAAIRGLTFANGGAILALLTFVGNQQGKVDLIQMRGAFEAFAFGLGFALASYLGAYYSQSWFAHSETSDAWNYQSDMLSKPRQYTEVANQERRRGWIFQLSALGLIVGSLINFTMGAFQALEAIT